MFSTKNLMAVTTIVGNHLMGVYPKSDQRLFNAMAENVAQKGDIYRIIPFQQALHEATSA